MLWYPFMFVKKNLDPPRSSPDHGSILTFLGEHLATFHYCMLGASTHSEYWILIKTIISWLILIWHRSFLVHFGYEIHHFVGGIWVWSMTFACIYKEPPFSEKKTPTKKNLNFHWQVLELDLHLVDEVWNWDCGENTKGGGTKGLMI